MEFGSIYPYQKSEPIEPPPTKKISFLRLGVGLIVSLGLAGAIYLLVKNMKKKSLSSNIANSSSQSVMTSRTSSSSSRNSSVPIASSSSPPVNNDSELKTRLKVPNLKPVTYNFPVSFAPDDRYNITFLSSQIGNIVASGTHSYSRNLLSYNEFDSGGRRELDFFDNANNEKIVFFLEDDKLICSIRYLHDGLEKIYFRLIPE